VDVRSLIKKAEKKVDEVELFCVEDSSRRVETAGSYIESFDQFVGAGCGLRILKKGKIGFSYFTDNSKFDQALKTAIGISKFSLNLGITLPARKEITEVEGLFDKKLSDLTEDKLSSIALDSIRSIKKAKPLKSFFTVSNTNIEVANSHGVDLKLQSTVFSANITSIFRKTSSAEEFDTAHTLDFDCNKLAVESARLAADSYSPIKVSGTFDVILSPIAFTEFLSAFFIPNVNGYKVARKESHFTDKHGDLIASENLTILDDSTIPAGIGSSPFDSEGTPCSKKAIIEHGVLKGFLFDLKSAALAGSTTTGNGFRSTFSSEPAISPTNIVIKGEMSDILTEVGRGIFVRDVMGIHTVNPTTGDFSLPVDIGFEFDGGELDRPISATLIGNFFEVFKNIRLGKDVKRVGNYLLPSAHIGKLDLVA
jgi:PmbA protein